jgi:hypothetical protein
LKSWIRPWTVQDNTRQNHTRLWLSHETVIPYPFLHQNTQFSWRLYVKIGREKSRWIIVVV